MNLTAIFKKDAAIIDHSWAERGGGLARTDDGLLMESIRNPNNTKPELEVQWGGGGEINLDEPAGVVKRLTEDGDGNLVEGVIVFARDLMNRGMSSRRVDASLKSRFPVSTLIQAKDELRSLFALDGLTGRVMVDARGYKSCGDAMKAASKSPHRRFIKFAYGCSCGTPHALPGNESSVLGDVSTSTGNPVDDFMASSDSTKRVVSHCRSTMLPIVASRGDLDKADMDGTLVEMMNLGLIPQSVVSSISKKASDGVSRVKMAFRWIDAQELAGDRKYAEKVDASDFVMDQSDGSIPVDGEVAPLGAVSLLGMDVGVEIADPFSTNFDGPARIPGLFDDLDIPEPADMSQIPVEIMDERDPSQIPLDSESLGDLDVDEQPGLVDVQIDDPSAPKMVDMDSRPADLEVELFDAPSTQDVDMSQFREPEFAGTDIVDLDEEKEVLAPLDVSMAQDMRI